MPDSIVTPCIRVCRIDPSTDTCMGCGRTLSEIAAWTRMTPAARDAVMARLATRRANG